MSDTIYQTVNFHFSVEFSTLPTDSVDVRFQSVTGLDATLDTETIKEGGENQFEHVIPVRKKYGPLILKRGVLKLADSKLTEWLIDWFKELLGVPKQGSDSLTGPIPIPTVNILLLGEDHLEIMSWAITNVWPRSWKVGELNAERGEVLIETLELNYNTLVFKSS